jgi:putative sugar O-methyltransferase
MTKSDEKTGDAVFEDAHISAIWAEVQASPDLYRPSRFWDDLNVVNDGWLKEFGFENFKRTVSQNYYNWLVTCRNDPQFRAVFKQWLRHPTPRPFLTEMDRPKLLRTLIGAERSFGRSAQLVYRLFVGMLWEVAIRQDHLGLNVRLEEPVLGNPLEVRRQGRRISQDLANSIRESNRIAQYLPLARGRPVIGELGAGYGRLAYSMLAGTGSRYSIFDIPPALLVSEWYLTRLFPARRIFRFRRFSRFEEVAEELAAADVAFFTPNQLLLFPEQHFDAFVSISTLPEMTLAQIDNYLALLGRLTRRVIYLKQWRRWRNEKDDFEFRYEQLRLAAEWLLRFDAADIVQPHFQERVWTRVGAELSDVVRTPA